MSVALLAISSFSNKLFWHTIYAFSNTVPEKSLIYITLVVYEFNFVVQDCG